MKTIEQERAYFAWKCVERIKLAKEGKWLEFRNRRWEQKEISTNNISFNELKKWSGIGGIGKGFWESLRNLIKRKLNKSEISEDEMKNNYSQIKEPLKANIIETYSSHAKRLSQMIISNSLVTTLAFYKSKDIARQQIFLDVQEWLKYRNFYNGDIHLIEDLSSREASNLRVITTESIAFANWLKRMAEVELD
jgi:CRISPR type III-B/RAMP module-associated protein Cmr5